MVEISLILNVFEIGLNVCFLWVNLSLKKLLNGLGGVIFGIVVRFCVFIIVWLYCLLKERFSWLFFCLRLKFVMVIFNKGLYVLFGLGVVCFCWFGGLCLLWMDVLLGSFYILMFVFVVIYIWFFCVLVGMVIVDSKRMGIKCCKCMVDFVR